MLQAVNVSSRNKAKLWRMTESGKNLHNYTKGRQSTTQQVACGVDTSAAVPDSQAFVVPDDCAGMRFDHVLAKLLPEYSRSRLQEWIAAGAGSLGGGGGAPKQKKRGGENHPPQPPT